jgi:hypothetical protein
LNSSNERNVRHAADAVLRLFDADSIIPLIFRSSTDTGPYSRGFQRERWHSTIRDYRERQRTSSSRSFCSTRLTSCWTSRTASMFAEILDTPCFTGKRTISGFEPADGGRDVVIWAVGGGVGGVALAMGGDEFVPPLTFVGSVVEEAVMTSSPA